jgi:hypothetical protein
MKKCSLRRNPMKMELGFNGGDLNLQTYRITTFSSQLVLNMLPHVTVALFNNLEGQYFNNLEGPYWKETHTLCNGSWSV